MTEPTPEYGRPDRPADPDLTGELVSSLDDIAAELAAGLDSAESPEFHELEVPGRPRYGIRCRLDFDEQEMAQWTQASRDTRFPDNLDGAKYNRLLIGATCTAILRDGEPILGRDGKPWDFSHPEVQELYQARSVQEAVAAFYGRRSGPMAGAANAVTRAAGWGEEARPLMRGTTGGRSR